MNTAKQLAALPADYHLRKHMVTAETVLSPIRADLYKPAAHKFVLHPHKNLFRNYRLVVVLNIILRHNAVVLDSLFGKIIYRVGLLVEVTGYTLQNLTHTPMKEIYIVKQFAANNRAKSHKYGISAYFYTYFFNYDEP